VARRGLWRRGVAWALGCYLAYALVSCFAPGVLTRSVGGGFQVGEVVAVAQVLVIVAGVRFHDHRAHRRIDALAHTLAPHQRHGTPREFGSAARDGAAGGADAFHAFDSFRAFGERPAL